MVVIQQSLATKFSTLQFFGVAVDRKSCSAFHVFFIVSVHTLLDSCVTNVWCG